MLCVFIIIIFVHNSYRTHDYSIETTATTVYGSSRRRFLRNFSGSRRRTCIASEHDRKSSAADGVASRVAIALLRDT